MALKVIEGNLLDIKEGIIAHQVNTAGVMGAGIALAIKNKWPYVYHEYQFECNQFNQTDKQILGHCHLVQLERPFDHFDGLYVANIFGQHLYGKKTRKTNYGAVSKAFSKLRAYSDIQVYVPYLMGCGLGGGDFEIYSEIIEAFIPNAIVVRLP